MSPINMSSNNDDNTHTCVVCYKNVTIYSIGDCDHPVCYECSTRMRVLCRQNECPICRHDMQKVIFTSRIKPYKILYNTLGLKYLVDRKFKIIFEDGVAQHEYNSLLAHVCSKCPGRHAFQTFNHLKDHMRKEHELFYCDLCVDNLKILTHERKAYTRKDLATHRRNGDLDNRSHRGHPLCEFCDTRYMDNDELYRHLRRDHLFCHFCDADGHHQYYESYEYLKAHFKEKHFLCEEGVCFEEKFTSAFRTEIDLKAHKASVHGRQMTKAAVKQARTLELEFTLKPRPGKVDQRRGIAKHQIVHNYIDDDDDDEEGAVGYYQPTYDPAAPPVCISNRNEFPSLGGCDIPTTHQSTKYRKPASGGVLAMTEEEFPALGGEATASVSLRVNSARPSDRTLSIRVNHRPAAVVTTVSQPRNKDPFPALSSKSQAPPVAQWKSTNEPTFSVKTKHNQASKPPQSAHSSSGKSYRFSEDDFPTPNNFPALKGNISSDIASLAASQWSLGREPEPKLSSSKSKPDPAPSKPPPPKTFHNEDDFPSLNSRFGASCSFSAESMPSKKVLNGSTIALENNCSTSTINPMRTDNISTDDVVEKKGNKKNKKKSKTKKATTPEPTVTGSVNEETNRKNKQKEEPKSKHKQMKVEAQTAIESNGEMKLGKKKAQNNSEKKRSELTISPNGPSQTAVENGQGNSNCPPGFSNVLKGKGQAPPGFQSSSLPPPGFSITLNSIVRPPSNDLTFTSSSGQNYPINAGDCGVARVFSYVPPPNPMSRNTQLVTQVTTALGTQSAFSEFMQMSALYRKGSLTPENYYDHCKTAMGPEAFNKIFPELLALLPDITKQQELWKVSAKEKLWKLMVCAACGQILAVADFRTHQATHSLENHFPTLTNGVSGPNAWAK